MRVSVSISYDGTNYLGSQVQKESTNTIFGQIEIILKRVGINSKIVASGRTDKGVHASGQVFHIDLPIYWKDLKKLKHTLNRMLPISIRVNFIKIVDDKFHARYSAKKRTYRYIIKEADSSNPFLSNYITFIEKVDFDSIKENIKLFIGIHDFKHFFKKGSDINTTTRVIYKAFTYKHKGYIILNFEANGFLRSQIRLMVSSLLKLTKKEITDKLECKKEYKIKPAPANGLYLAKIKY